MADLGSAVKRNGRKGSYHFGDLRSALVGAAVELAGRGGPSAVTVRAAARRVGVTPTAAYRHFTNHGQLLRVAKEQAQCSLFGAMSAALATLEPGTHGVTRLNAAGRGYIAFAMSEPGLFRTAFCDTADGEERDSPAFDLLSELLDELVEVGFTDPTHRPNAEMAAWSTVHGLASLVLDRAGIDAVTREQTITDTLAAIERCFATGPNATDYRSR
ncbi:TetR/AcrR family transcriptional regulator [Nocardia sp. NPDC005998]|uniref:TetR/AcrR family transcriptional regulator n=1 Tax=Nocardia sp. NPDC005998 TaxID=3156894 RepID=UPI0033A1865B